jgi:hypothetical protein
MSVWDLDSDDESVGEIILQLEDNINNGDNDDSRGLGDVIDDFNLGDLNDIIDNMALDGANYRSLGPGTSPLCRLMTKHAANNTCVESGYVGNTGYIIPKDV